MNLNQLVQLRNSLTKAIDLSIIKQEIESNSNRLEILNKNVDNSLQQQLSQLIDQHKNNLINFAADTKFCQDIVDQVQNKINHIAKQFFSDNYKLEYSYNNIEAIRRVRIMIPNDEFESVLLKRINHLSTWKFPALEIGCRDGEWTKQLVASDPLYITDYFPEFLDSAVQQFPSLYQGRVRKYLIHDYHQIDNLPLNQFSLIFSFNFFNYLSLDSIKQLMIQSFSWLRPGGKVIFTYNNADMPAAAAYAENYFMTYVPKSILIPMVESLGFTKSFCFDLEPSFSMIEFTKPGTPETIKAGQVLGEIKIKS